MTVAILTRLVEREQTIEVEQTAHYALSVTNQGKTAARFDVGSDGLPESWLSFAPASLHLAPGESATLTLRITPPRLATSRAGYYDFSLLVTSPAYPGQCSRQDATLYLQPFHAFSIELLDDASQPIAWVSHQGNSPTLFRLGGAGEHEPRGWRFDFEGGTEIALQPGMCASVPIAVTPPPSLHALLGQPRSFTLTLTRVGAETPSETRSVRGSVRSSMSSTPLFFAGVGLCGLLLMALLLSFFPGSAVALPPEVSVPTAAGLSAPAASGRFHPTAPVDYVGATTRLVEAAPLVPVFVPTPIPEAAFLALSETIAPPAQAASVSFFQSPLVEAAPASTSMTYEAMFKEIGERYDLDWHLLASMAYKESTLNPTAIGRDGDMGLMQIMPATWDQIAPLAGVSDPYDPYSNALAGAAFLRYLRDDFQSQGHSELYWALLAYNWGPNNLKQHLRAGHGWAEVPWLKQKYVWDIMTEAATPSAPWWQEQLLQPLP